MKDQTKRDVLALCDAASRMRTAVNMLWWANNPEEDVGAPGDPPTVEEAQLAHSEAFNALSRAEYYARRALEKEPMVGEKDMERARLTAAKAVLTQALAEKARNGDQEWAQRWLKRMDQAMLDVRPEDLVRAHVNNG